MLDNASIHKGDDVQKVCNDKGFSVLYTPPYSPWFNPIESCFSIVKRKYPKMQNIDRCFDAVTPDHFKSYFRHALKKYGLDDTEELLHKAEMTKPFVGKEGSCTKLKKPSVERSVSKTENKEVNVEKRPQSDGTTLIVRTVKKTITTVETRGTKTRTDTQVTSTTTSRVAKPGKVKGEKNIKKENSL